MRSDERKRQAMFNSTREIHVPEYRSETRRRVEAFWPRAVL